MSNSRYNGKPTFSPIGRCSKRTDTSMTNLLTPTKCNQSFLSSTRLTPIRTTPRYSLSKPVVGAVEATRNSKSPNSTQYNSNSTFYSPNKVNTSSLSEASSRASTPTHQAKYGRVGLFPVVHFFQKKVPIITPKQNSCVIKLSSNGPGLFGDTGEAYELLNNVATSQATEASTRSVLDALKEISRKRIHGNESYDKEKDKPNEYSKRTRDDDSSTSPKSGTTSPQQAPKRICVVDPIYASNTSSFCLKNNKRKLYNAWITTNEQKSKKVMTVETQTQTVEEKNQAPIQTSAAAQAQEKATNTSDSCQTAVPNNKTSQTVVEYPVDEAEKKVETPDSSPSASHRAWDEKIYAIHKKNKLAIVLSRITGEDPKLIPVPRLWDKSTPQATDVTDANPDSSVSPEKDTPTLNGPTTPKLPESTLNFGFKTTAATETTTCIATPISSVSSSILPMLAEVTSSIATPTASISFGVLPTSASSTTKEATVASTVTTAVGNSFGFMSRLTSTTSTTANIAAENNATTMTPSLQFGTSVATTPTTSSPGVGGFKFDVGKSPSAPTLTTGLQFGSSIGKTGLFLPPSGNPTSPVFFKPGVTSEGSSSSKPTAIVNSFGGTPLTAGIATVSNNLPAFSALTTSSGFSTTVTTASGFSATAATASGFGTTTSPSAFGTTTTPAFATSITSSAFGAAATIAATSQFTINNLNNATPSFTVPQTSTTPAVISAPASTGPSGGFSFKSAIAPSAPSMFGGSVTTTTSSGLGAGTMFNKSGFGATTSGFGTASSGFGGATSSPPPAYDSTTAPSATTSGFGSNFGATATTTATSAPPAYDTTSGGFGSSNRQPPAYGANSNVTVAKGGFGEGNGAGGGFTFGGGAPTSALPAFVAATTTTTPAFGATTVTTPAFGAPTATTPAFGATTATTPAFGATTATTPAFGATIAATPAFGATTVTTPAFGATTTASCGFGNTSTTNGAPGGFAFGASANNPGFGASASSGFGASSGIPAFGATTNPAATPTFGATTTTASMFAFGGNTANKTVSSGFGGGSTANSSGFAFNANAGAPATTTAAPAFGSGGNSVFSFGPSVTTTASGFGFGAQNSATTATPSFGASNSGFGNPSPAFGSTATTQSAGFGVAPNVNPFGKAPNPPAFGATAPSATPAFGASSAQPPAFGATSPSTTPAFGGGFGQTSATSTNFNSSFGNPTNPPSTSFGFGSPSTTNNTGFGAGGFGSGNSFVTPTTNTFSFKAAQSPPDPSKPVFAFGQQETPKSTTGAFNFSGGAATTQNFGGGFGAAATQQPGMFSIGAGTSTAPSKRVHLRAKRRT